MQASLEKFKYGLSPKWTLVYILVLSVFLDIAFGALTYFGVGGIPVSLLYRVTILAAFMVVLFRFTDFESWYIKAVIALWLICLSFWIASYGGVPLVLEVNQFLRALFIMCIALLSYNALCHAHRANTDVSDWIAKGIIFYACVAACSIIFSFMTGIGRPTYGPWAFGHKSFFTGGNDIGLAMLVGLVMAWCRLWRKETMTNVGLIVLITAGISLIGSRAAWGGVLGITITFALGYLMVKKATNRFTYAIKVAILVVVIGGGGFATKVVYDNLDAVAFTFARVTDLLDGVSPRAHLQKVGYEVLEDRSTAHDVFGQGSKFYFEIKERFSYHNRSFSSDGRDGQLTHKAIEQDPFDLYGTYGLILGGMFIMYNFFYWLWSCRLFLAHRNIEFFGISFALTIYVFHGSFAGHAFITPQVATVVGCLLGLIRYRAKVIELERKQGLRP